MAEIAFEKASKIFPDGTAGVRDLDLEVGDGEFMVLVGPSGSGKSTALRLVAGLEEITSGAIRIGDRIVNDAPPRDRDIAMVFQNYALYPHMSVFDNMAFGLKLQRKPKDEIRRRVEEAAEVLGIREYLSRKPKQLSGGQRQRVAMGRAIVREPACFLMDEPLSNLDAKLRVQVRAELARLHQRLGTTTLYVTHDQVEAMTLGQRVAVMRNAQLQQADTPERLYARPDNLFVAGFIGSPSMNMVTVHLARSDGQTFATFGSRRLRIPEEVLNTREGLAAFAGREVVMGIRPEAFEDVEIVPGAEPDQVLEVDVALTEMLGAEILAHFDVDAPPVVTEDTMDLARDLGDADAGSSRTHATFTARLDPRSSVRQGRPAKLAVDVDRLYFFDPQTGKAIW